MKTCTACGKEHLDDAIHCLVDGTPLAGGELQPAVGVAAVAILDSPLPPIISTEPVPLATARWTERQILLIEILVVCSVAFGGSIFVSVYSLFSETNASSRSSASYTWGYAIVHAITALALVWLVLLRRSKSLSDIGFSWRKKDFGWSIPLWLGAGLAFYLCYLVFYAVGLVSVSSAKAESQVANHLFSSGISVVTWLYLCLNPFFEELLVRAYLMTELKRLANSPLVAVLVSTMLQITYHLYQGVPLALSDGAAFLVFSLYFAKTNRIAPIILAHLYMDLGAMLIHVARG